MTINEKLLNIQKKVDHLIRDGKNQSDKYDFASDETRRIGDALIERELAGIKEWVPKFYPSVMKQYEATCAGSRDLFF